MKILAIDTSTKTGSVALADDGSVISEMMLNVEATHSETLLAIIKNMLEEASTPIEEVDLLAVTEGPGSFTGIRIGVSTIKGLAMALDKPVVGVSTLEAMASNFPYSACKIKPLMDARKGEVYTADFRWEGDCLKRVSEDRAEPPEVMLGKVSDKTIFVGDGLIRYGAIIKERLGEEAVFAEPEYGNVRGSVVARIALSSFRDFGGHELATFTPTYLRRSEAEINREKGLLKGC